MHLVGFIIRIYHEERSPERQKCRSNFNNNFIIINFVFVGIIININ